jgi:hydrogenase/urease accessory protein HupE
MDQVSASKVTAATLFPLWFFQHFGTFPPFNQHYEGDLGAYILAVGIGLLVATPAPEKYPWVIRIGALASLFHAANHLSGALLSPSLNAWVQTVEIATTGLLLVAASMTAGKREVA